MIQTIRVQTIIGPDLRAQGVLHDIQTMLKINSVKNVATAIVYRLEGASQKQAKLLAEKLFCEKINQTYTINKSILPKDASAVEIGYKPGVMNPQVASIIKVASDLGIHLTAADSSIEYGFFGNLKNGDAQNFALKLKLFNPIVEHIVEGKPKTLVIKGAVGPTNTIPLRNMTDVELMKLSKDKLFLNLNEMHVIQRYFQKIKRDPTDCELETLAQTWSEHCSHKTFKAKLIIDGKEKEPLFSRLKKEALKHDKHIVSAFVDNSGVMDFYDGFAICGKAETHNSPSAIEPYGGAMTGSGGVFRDVVATGQGAKAIASTDIFCFAPPDMPSSKLPAGCLPPDYLLKRTVAAVKDYGNRVGIPTNNGSFHFHNDFRAKPTVLVGAYGIVPKKSAQKGSPKIGDAVVAVGGATGRDGIHGATFSSGEMTDRTISVNSTAVQIGNAIEEKRTFDALLEARDKGCIRAMQDLGAGGFSSAIGEMGEKTGVSVDLSKAKLKYEGLAPWEIWVSESQERMLAAVPKTKLKTFLAICKKYNVESCVLGTFDGSRKLRVYYGKKLVCELSMEFLHHGLPQRTMIAQKPSSKISQHPRSPKFSLLPKTQNEWLAVLKKILSDPNICSKEPIVRLYDHSVQGTSVVPPYSGEKFDGPNDAAVVRPLLNKPYGVVISHGLNPVLNNTDVYWGTLWAGVEALANYVTVGGDYIAASLINNYIFPFPDPQTLYELDRCVDAVVDMMKTFKIPVISGKDSLSSTYRGKNGEVIKIPPTLCMSVFGKISDVSKTTTADFKKTNSTIVLVGKQDFANSVPHVDLKNLPKVFSAVTKGIQSGDILACHDVSEGGIAASCFEMCVGG
ncbi:MAG TPA: AIR synthase-related protein, partial [Candidatus Saccharimonadales bacterium]|nr:AIR synthase-related protein [Candidatus Saccharimonadales bacterium]